MQHPLARPIPRRPLLLAPLLAAPFIRRAHAAALPGGVPPERRLAFDVFRNDSKIGTHVLGFTPDNDRLTVDIAIHVAAGIGPLTLYRYTMTGQEIWQNGQFLALDTTTDDDGTHHIVSVRRVAAGLQVQSTHFPTATLPAETSPLTHWNEAALHGPLLSPQDGQPMKTVITPAGRGSIALENGQSVPATGYDIKTKSPLQDWYDTARTWVALQALAKDGSTINYKRT